jgi:prevent-host-death family protein
MSIMTIPRRMDVAEAKKRFSELLGHVAFGGARVLITRRGRPMARLVPVDEPGPGSGLADVRGWLEDDDPFLQELDRIVAGRATDRPRPVALPARRRRRASR